MATVLHVLADTDGQWKDLEQRDLEWFGADQRATLTIGGLAAGMTSGKPSVAIRIDYPDNRTVVVETSLANFLMAADALRIRHGDPRT